MLRADVSDASMVLKSFPCDAMHKSSAQMKLRVSGCMGWSLVFFSLGPFNINKSQFRCPHVVTPFGVAGRGKASREIAYIGHSVFWEPECTI